jgi:endonuclease YncB( thermonuclease family)
VLSPDAARSDREPERFLREGALGTVSLVIDGDTVHVTVDGWYHRVRLQGINAPECSMSLRSTPNGSQYTCTSDDEWWGLGSADALRGLIEGETVTVFCDQSPGDVCPIDNFDRFLAFLEGPEGDIAEVQARNGHAMSFTRFSSTRRATYCEAEDAAIAEGLGMWSLGDRDTVLDRMSDGTQGWYDDRDERCAEAVGER